MGAVLTGPSVFGLAVTTAVPTDRFARKAMAKRDEAAGLSR
jgi:hypothetical protein